MAEESSSISLSKGLPETILPLPAQEWIDELEDARTTPVDERREAISMVAGDHPKMLSAWADLAELSDDVVESYAYARVGYHRGLDALRGAGWRGTGFVRWREESNRGFLRCLEALRSAAGQIGELDEEERCRLFLYQLDPDWARSMRR